MNILSFTINFLRLILDFIEYISLIIGFLIIVLLIIIVTSLIFLNKHINIEFILFLCLCFRIETYLFKDQSDINFILPYININTVSITGKNKVYGFIGGDMFLGYISKDNKKRRLYLMLNLDDIEKFGKNKTIEDRKKFEMLFN